MIDMLNDRNLTSHTYNEEHAIQVASRIPNFLDKMNDCYSSLVVAVSAFKEIRTST